VVLADHSKWNLNGLCTIMPLSGAAMVITDSSLRADARGVLTRECSNLRIVDASADVQGNPTAPPVSQRK